MAETLRLTELIQVFKNDVELVPPTPPVLGNVIGRIRQTVVRRPRYQIKIREVKTVRQHVSCPIVIPAFKYQINKVRCAVQIFEQLQRVIASLTLITKQAIVARASIQIAELKQKAQVSRIQLAPTFNTKTKSKILIQQTTQICQTCAIIVPYRPSRLIASIYLKWQLLHMYFQFRKFLS